MLLFTKAIAQETKYIAVFLYNFTRHIEWPDNAKTGDFVIGVVNDDNIYNELMGIANGKNVGPQTISVRKYRRVEEADNCHILYLSEGQSHRVNAAIEKAAGFPTLFVTRLDGATARGSAINFVVRDGVMRFELKKSNGARFGLRIHSRLDNMAILID